MLGTIVNVSTIAVGSTVGALLHKGIKDRYRITITQALGFVASSLGITWIVQNMMNNKEPLLFIASLVIGGLIGCFFKLEERIERLGDRFNKNGESNVLQGIVTAVMLFCMGTLSILGPIKSALEGDNTLLYTNALLDGITSLILASTFGIGIIVSAGVLLVWQGSIYLLAQFIAPYVTPDLMAQISIIGGILILGTGINILEIKKIRTLNLLPALIVPPVYFVIKILIA